MIKPLTCAILALGAFPALASTPPLGWVVNLGQGSGSIEFDATGHPSALKIVGRGAGPQGIFQIHDGRVSGVASFDLDTLDTGIAMRTRHMKEKYLETKKYRRAVLTITRIDLPGGGVAGRIHADSVPFSGMLLLHGVKKPVKGIAQIDAQAGARQVAIGANFDLKVSDYGITIPSFAGITMADEVNVSVKDLASLQSESGPLQ